MNFTYRYTIHKHGIIRETDLYENMNCINRFKSEPVSNTQMKYYEHDILINIFVSSSITRQDLTIGGCDVVLHSYGVY